MTRSLKQRTIPCKNKARGCGRYFSTPNGVSIHLASCPFRKVSFGPHVQPNLCRHPSHPLPQEQPDLENHTSSDDDGPFDCASPEQSEEPIIHDSEPASGVPKEDIEYHPVVNGALSMSLLV